MNNADKFKQIFDVYATALWAMPEKDFLAWLQRDAPETNVGELIRKQEAINAIENTDCELSPDAWDELTNAIMKLPTAEPKRGKWELVDEAEPRRYGCSECKRLSYTQDNYCSYCGAKMKKRSFLINWSESEGYCDYE